MKSNNTFIEPALKLIDRSKERFLLRPTIGDRLKNSKAKIVCMPIPLPIPYSKPGWDETPFLEGGDVFVLGSDIYVGCSENGRACLQTPYHMGQKAIATELLCGLNTQQVFGERQFSWC